VAHGFSGGRGISLSFHLSISVRQWKVIFGSSLPATDMPLPAPLQSSNQDEAGGKGKRRQDYDHRHSPQSEPHHFPGAHFFPALPRKSEDEHGCQ
jgi:hypothetical protein